MAQLTVVVDSLPEPRRALLDALKRKGPQTAAGLAEALALSPSGIRAHMALLASDGYVTVVAERHGVGRPTHRYSLSPAGDALFPRSYSGYVHLLFRSMDKRQPGSVSAAIRGMFEDRAEQLAGRVFDPDLGQTVENLLPYLTGNGFIPESELLPEGSVQVTLLNCPVLDVAEAYPCQCEHEQWYLAEVLRADRVERTAFRFAGDAVCAYRISRTRPLDGASPGHRSAPGNPSPEPERQA